MICRIDGAVLRGEAVTLPPATDPDAVLAGIRNAAGEADPEERAAGTDSSDPGDECIRIDCASPLAVHEHIGHLHEGMALRTKTALARAGRSCGISTPVDGEIESLRAQIEEIDVESAALSEHRAAVAEAQEETTRLREDAAATRGELQAFRDVYGEGETETAVEMAGGQQTEVTGKAAGEQQPNAGGEQQPDAGAVTRTQKELHETIQTLSEVETTLTAAKQRHEQARKAARERRNRRERRFRLEDRLANLEREARETLLEAVRPDFERAVAAVPGVEPPADPFEADPLVAGLGVARVAAVDAPLVVDCPQFETAESARAFLDAPVVYIR